MKGLIFKHYLFRSLKEPVGIGIVTVLPTVLIIIMTMVFTGMAGDSAAYMHNGYNMIASSMAPMIMVMFQFFGGNVLLDYIHVDFRGDRRWRMFSMPVKTNDYVLGALSACFVFCVIQGAIIIAISAIFLNAYWGNLWVLALTLIACSGLSQMIWMLLFLLFPKKGTVEVIGQCVIWVMLFASGYIDVVSGGNAPQVSSPVLTFFSSYGTPVSLARRAITNSGFIGGDKSDALLCLGLLYALLAVFALIVILIGKRQGFASEKREIPVSTAPSRPKKEGIREKFENFWGKVENLGNIGAEPKPQEPADISEQRDLVLTAPTHRGGRLTIYKFALLRAWRNPLSLVFNAALPLTLILIPGLWNGQGAMGFSFVGVAIMYGAFMAARGILNDKLDGTLIRIFTTPTSSLKYLSQNLMAAMTPLTAQILAVGIIGSSLYKWELGFTLSLMLLYFLFAAASVAFSFAWSCLFKERETSYAVFAVMMNVVAMLGGFYIPLQVMPSSLRYIGALFPAFWASNGILALQGGAAMGGYWLSAAVIALFAVLYMVYGSKRRIV
ncbi:ABC transporter permease [Eubacteriales bacterium OttesenSCG-928-A19]|nr:ABC transporter permease [Eubacteriales bacterium OttesenSCG-928-A19]